MKKPKMKTQLVSGAFLLAAGLFTTSCIDNSFDLSEDMDMTMELGSSGLQVKLGNSENIMLRDILEIDDDSNIDTTRNGLYYLVEDGTTNFEFNVDPVTATIDEAMLTPSVEIVNFDKVIAEEGYTGVVNRVTIPAGQSYGGTAEDAVSQFDINVDDVSDEIKSIKRIAPRGGRFRLMMEVEQSTGMDFVIERMENVQLHLPSFARSDEAPNGVYNIGTRTVNAYRVDLGTFTLDNVEFEGEKGMDIVNNLLAVHDQISMTGDFYFKANSSFDMVSGNFANVRLTVSIDGSTSGQIEVAEVEGVFDPVINPDVDPIRIGDELPDFLQDDAVRIMVSNPTVKFNVDMRQIPVDLNFRADVNSMKGGQNLVPTVSLPGIGSQELKGSQENLVYFYQGDAPFDLEAIPANAVTSKVENLSTLVETLPDELAIDLNDKKVAVNQDRLYTIELGRPVPYAAGVDYQVLVPMKFDAGLCIVYNDEVDEMNEDLKDYEADGITLTADAVNTVPLDLVASIKAVGLDGLELPNIEISDATIAAATANGASNTPITLTITLANRADLKKLDKIKFTVTAKAQSSDELRSDQYLRLENMRVKLNGTITANFN